MNRILLLVACILFLGSGCGDQAVLVPKPRAYPKVIYPERAYKDFESPYCDFTFKMPVYAEMVRDTLFFNEKPVNDCWFDILIPMFDARVHCSYYEVSKDNPLDKLRDDAFKMANKHSMKATFIDELKIEKPNNVSGFIFNIEGPAASPFQFFLTDEENHFLRGALYFNTQAEPDSLAPVIEFVKYDITEMVNTFEWRD